MPVFNINANGTTHSGDACPAATLLSMLRENLDFTGARYGYREGQYGAYSRIIKAVRQAAQGAKRA
jgi:aerobic-type carbon monoxide dehydrogenase small subunit (CoxS/CutS family)